MPNWDIFHSDRLEVERNLTTSAVRDGASRGAIVQGDLARAAGSGEPWVRLSDHAQLAALFGAGGAGSRKAGTPPRVADSTSLRSMVDEDDEAPDAPAPAPRAPLRRGPEKAPGSVPLPSGVNKGTTEDLDPAGFPDSYDRDLDLSLRDPKDEVPLGRDRGDDLDDYDPEAEDEEAAEFTFTRGGAETVEELDLAAMVDVAFQLVLFFLVTASTVVFKSLEVPKPKPQEGKGAATQSSGRTVEQLTKDYILVEIDASGAVKIDHEDGPNDFNGLVAKLREVRTKTDRLSMLLTADSLTKHKNAVNAFDAANEIGLGIAIATPKPAADKPAPPPPPKLP